MAKRKATTTDAQEKTKKPKLEETSDAGSGEEAPRTAKKPKKHVKKEESDEEEEQEDSDVINLGKNKRVTVREFKGNVLIDIREFY
ncbi:hypothetical protein FB45DRAFT_194997 [Roridomyces roridus]|uniref:Transcriptional coactivator p15 (PC4) C-terminal domain-containing protein n=1 Tax=Roridomyces roridus TaxID=1738132 RepID=A0AAD7CF69_9AGAR|nr:hypothetical protein FB45DRAFT_194997 [Roridomyces roridus]